MRLVFKSAPDPRAIIDAKEITCQPGSGRCVGIGWLLVLCAAKVKWSCDRGTPTSTSARFFAMPDCHRPGRGPASKFYQHISSPTFWQRALGPEGYRRVIAEKQGIEQRLGLSLTEPTINLLLGREFGLALVPSQSNIVDVIVYARVSGAEKIAET
jgi:hypothetical protein